MCKNSAIAVAKAISTVAKLNTKKREDTWLRQYALWVFFKLSPGNKKHLILNKAVLSRLIDSIYYTCQYIKYILPYSVIKMGGLGGM